MFIYALGTGTRGERARFRRDIVHTCQRVCRVKNVEHARVFDAVIDAQAIFALRNQTGLAEKHQLLRDVCLALPQQRSEMTDALFAVAQRVKQAQARGMRERAEKLG